jgi:segregation and condensation protein A
MDEQYIIKIQKFEGPLDLLLQLIEKEELSITEVSLVAVTDQYVSYLKTFENRSPEMLADFLVIAAKLLLIKSRALLPFLSEADEEVEEDLRELEERLKLYKKFKELAKEVGILWSSPNISYEREFSYPQNDIFIPPHNLCLSSLSDAISKVLLYTQKTQEIKEGMKTKMENVIRLEEKIKRMRDFFAKVAQAKLSEILKDSKNKAEIIVTFLALLELVKQNIVAFKQEKIFGETEFNVKSKIETAAAPDAVLTN